MSYVWNLLDVLLLWMLLYCCFGCCLIALDVVLCLMSYVWNLSVVLLLWMLSYALDAVLCLNVLVFCYMTHTSFVVFFYRTQTSFVVFFCKTQTSFVVFF